MGAEPGSVGLAGGGTAAGPRGRARATEAAGIHLYPSPQRCGVASRPFDLWLPLACCPPAPGHVGVPRSLSLAAPLLFVSASQQPARHHARPVCLCPWSGLRCFPSPHGSPPRLCPLGLYLVLPTSVPLPPPTSPAEPFSLWNLSGSPYLCLSWPGLHVPVSPRACAWVGMGVSLEKSLSASRLQLQAGCHGNRVRGPRCNS